MNLWCSFHSLEVSFFEGEITCVHLPALDGDLTILPRHTPLMTFLRAGFVRLVLPHDNHVLAFSLSSGFASVTSTHVKILVREACVFQEGAEAPFPEQSLIFDGEG